MCIEPHILSCRHLVVLFFLVVFVLALLLFVPALFLFLFLFLPFFNVLQHFIFQFFFVLVLVVESSPPNSNGYYFLAFTVFNQFVLVVVSPTGNSF